jgi:hypothetical protein
LDAHPASRTASDENAQPALFSRSLLVGGLQPPVWSRDSALFLDQFFMPGSSPRGMKTRTLSLFSGQRMRALFVDHLDLWGFVSHFSVSFSGYNVLLPRFAGRKI